MKNVIVGTAGHIDHGKTALVKALTGIDTDRLKEEKLRGITIDLGFAHLELDGVKFGFIDVPGHERFVKNMLAGVGGIDMVLLVVAADESVMPQTREHFDICKLLRIQSGIIAITKKDLVDEELLELVKAEVRELTANSFLDGAEIIACSAKTGEGIDELKGALLKLARQIRGRKAEGIFRLPIDRAFTIRGFGTVVTGTLLSGQIAKEAEVQILPSGARARVRGIQVYGQTTERAFAGQRTALNLHGVAVEALERGMVLAPPDMLSPSSLLDVKLKLLESAARPLKSLSKVRFHHGTSEIIARVVLLGQPELQPGHEAYAQLRLERPAVTLIGDPFIVRQFSPMITIGGGIILDNLPQKHKQTDRETVSLLETIEGSDLSEKLAAFIRRAGPRGIGEGMLIARFGLTRDELGRELEKLEAEGGIKIVSRNPFHLIDSESYRRLCQAVTEEIKGFHARDPLLKGMPKEELRRRLFGDAPQELFKFVIDDLVRAERLVVLEDLVALYGRQLALSPEEQQLKASIEEAFRSGGLEPPTLDELVARLSSSASEEKIKRIFYLLIKDRVLVKIAEDLAFHSDVLCCLKQKLRQRFPPGSKFSVPEFKDLFGITRKFAIPLLEHLDRERITRRVGNERLVL